MQIWEDDEASATDRIVDLKTGETVGLIYQWQDGEKQAFWFTEKREDVIAICLYGSLKRWSGS